MTKLHDDRASPVNPLNFSQDLRVPVPLRSQQPGGGRVAEKAGKGVGGDGGHGVTLAVAEESAEAGERRCGRPLPRRHRLRVFRVGWVRRKKEASALLLFSEF